MLHFVLESAGVGWQPTDYKVVPILYDLIPLVQSAIYLTPHPFYGRFYHQKIDYLKRADAWLTISDRVFQEALDHLHLDASRMSNILGPCDPVLTTADHPSWDASALRALEAMSRLQVNQTNLNIDELQHRQIQIIAALRPSMTDDELMRCASMIALNQPRAGSKKLFVDISELARHDTATGVQRVARSILFQLVQHPPKGFDVQPVYATTNELGYRQANLFMAKFIPSSANQIDVLRDEMIETQAGDVFLGLDLQHQVTIFQATYLSALRARGVAVHFVIYDLLPIHFPQFCPSVLGNTHADLLRVLANFDGAICISKAVADELRQWLLLNVDPPLRPYKIEWFHPGADFDNSKPTLGLPDDGSAVLEKLSVRPTFLSVGRIEPHQAHDVTLAAFENLWAQGLDINLVLVGQQGWHVDDLVAKLQKHPERGIRLFWLPGVSDEYLAKIYASATCLITASLSEGFGFHLIEAAQHNRPIIARDIPVFREVAGNDATYFSGDASALTTVVTRWLLENRSKKYTAPSEIKWLTWQESAEQLKSVLLS